MSYEIINPSKESLYEYVGVAYDMSTYVRFDKYGLYGIKNNANFIASSPEDIENNASFGVTWKGFFIKNSYTNGYISISEDDDIKVVKIINDNEIKKIKIGALGFDINGNPTSYGITIRNDNDLEVFRTDDGGNIEANNISIRGSIKASVFEYEEIQAIGGILVVRPSTTIKDIIDTEYFYHTFDNHIRPGKIYYESINNEYVEVQNPEESQLGSYYESSTEIILEKPDIFQGSDYCKLGKDGRYYTLTIKEDEEGIHYILQGLTKNSNDIYYLPPEEIIGSALISMVSVDTSDGGNPKIYNNYGIAINSSDSRVQAPAKAITLFETKAEIVPGAYVIKPDSEGFSYRGVLGNLPDFSRQETNKVDNLYSLYMTNTQGIYTDNMYIGDNNEFIAFYTVPNVETYIKTTDIEIIEGKNYYTYNVETNTYEEVLNPSILDIGQYYELILQDQKHLSIQVTDLNIKAGQGNSTTLLDFMNQTTQALNNQNNNLEIDKSYILLYRTGEEGTAAENKIVNALALTSDRLQFINAPEGLQSAPGNTRIQELNNIQKQSTWIDSESLNSNTFYFTSMYPRIFNGDDDLPQNGLGNLIIYSRDNGHLTIKNIK